eukprot:COSAG03_NODE_6525_length_1045_cov_1.599789_2_plen_42_part_01
MNVERLWEVTRNVGVNSFAALSSPHRNSDEIQTDRGGGGGGG